ncbi:MAG TPA: undecaprenyldiphospho-muramoylpentapeptide beta-N-acetylglucosaminyltransferase [Nitrospira sp.]|nr:undecaprenyldiphospho-muramoylpentapeptide beta-N-acetylglucosaminyltransferase [Nitrospira sp.]
MTIVIAAGGTGGHLYPAIALAHEFLRRDPASRILFVGTSRGLESKVLAHEGFELALIDAKPVMGLGPWGMLKGLCAVPISLWQSLRILRSRHARLVIGVGGYTSPAMVFAAAMLGVACVILEPNADAGMANKAVASVAQRVFLAFESAAASFNPQKVRIVGTPIRRAFIDRAGPVAVPGRQPGARRLLVFGGSQGAKAINSAMIEGLPEMIRRCPEMSVIHQTGEADHTRVAEAYRRAGLGAQVVPFIYDMPSALHEADLVVARAGAITIAELTTSGKPAVLIPLPTAIYDHQMKNATAMQAAGAAVVLRQSELTGARLAHTVIGIIEDPARLQAMAAATWRLRRTDAAEAIVRECYGLMGEQYDNDHRLGEAGHQ